MPKASKPVCGVVMLEGKEARRLAGWKPVRCQLPPQHEGNHYAQTKQAKFQWWNKEKNPVKEAMLVLALLIGTLASAQTVPVKVTITWNDAAHTPITNQNFIVQQDMDGAGNNWFQWCNVPLDSTGTATCNIGTNAAYTNTYRFAMKNAAGDLFCDTNQMCSVTVTADPDMVKEVMGHTDNVIVVRISTAFDTITGVSFNP